ncbi:hypothetical protein D2E22_1217 [Bifidobacterium castoris]|uniref:Uncharacterized protein n=1 Tax=Bifidobacterium castoris TaxID=2306972 RepID=A0A430F6R7_9BIFI|nr:hypothetical protein D2E22_1217 [Bifidobacterium castoris]
MHTLLIVLLPLMQACLHRLLPYLGTPHDSIFKTLLHAPLVFIPCCFQMLEDGFIGQLQWALGIQRVVQQLQHLFLSHVLCAKAYACHEYFLMNA